MIAVVCLACADACKLCAAECSKHEDPQMKECVAACKACETACRAMAKAIAESPAKAEQPGQVSRRARAPFTSYPHGHLVPSMR